MNPLEKEQAKADREYKKERGLLLAKVRDVAETPSGKSLIWEVLSMCGLYQSTFTGNSQGAFLEGKRAVGLEILELLSEMDKTFYPALLLNKAKEIK